MSAPSSPRSTSGAAEPTGRIHRALALQSAVGALLAEGPPERDRLRRLLELLCDGLELAFAAAWLREGDRLRCVAVFSPDTSPALARFGQDCFEQRFGRSSGLPGEAWATGTAVWVTDLLWDPRMGSVAGAHRAGLRSAVALPLNAGEDCVGVLECFTDDTRPPETALGLALEGVAAQVAQHVARWRTEDTLTRRERALGAAVNGIVISDATRPGFPIVYANPGFERLTGYSSEEVCGRPCSLLQGPGTDADATEHFGELLRAGRDGQVTLLNYRKDGTAFWNEVVISPVRDGYGRVVEYIGVQNDVTERRAAEDQAAFLAYHDPLTELPNRAVLARVLDRAADRARTHGLQAALINLDLDRFKEVNDAHGHAAGDELLRGAAARLQGTVAPGDLLVRQGGDEFLLLLADLDPARAVERALAAGERLGGSLLEPVDVLGHAVRVRGSIGISILGHDAEDVDALMRHADVAMYRAKRSGGGIRLYRSNRPTAEPAAGARADGTDPSDAALDAAALDAVLTGDAITSAYQPIVDLDTGEVVAYEALARGPGSSPLARPDLLFAAAEAHERVAELDWACRAAALRGALATPLARSRPLFVNVEPAALGTPCPDRFAPIWERGHGELDVVLEITERALTARPADLLALVAQVRRRGWGIALDDVGADVRSLALMPLLRPDVIKLDLRLVQEQPSTEVAEIVNAVCAERERTGAVVLAEGIETPKHLALARSLGATLGQGWHLGRPGELAPPEDPPTRPLLLSSAEAPTVSAPMPYEVVRPVREVRRGDKRLLVALSIQLEQQAASLGETAVIVSAFQSADRFTAPTHRRYTLLAADAAFVAALGVGMAPEPAPGVRGAALDPADPLLGEWSVAVLGPHFAAALVAVDLGDTGDDFDRRFDFALTYDRDLVIEAASALMRRVQPLGS